MYRVYVRSPWDLVEDGLATHRLTRLVLTDKISQPLRDKVWAKFDPGSTRLGYLITCPWCTSIWIGAGVAVARHVTPGLWSVAARALAVSDLTGIAEERL